MIFGSKRTNNIVELGSLTEDQVKNLISTTHSVLKTLVQENLEGQRMVGSYSGQRINVPRRHGSYSIPHFEESERIITLSAGSVDLTRSMVSDPVFQKTLDGLATALTGTSTGAILDLETVENDLGVEGAGYIAVLDNILQAVQAQKDASSVRHTALKTALVDKRTELNAAAKFGRTNGYDVSVTRGILNDYVLALANVNKSLDSSVDTEALLLGSLAVYDSLNRLGGFMILPSGLVTPIKDALGYVSERLVTGVPTDFTISAKPYVGSLDDVATAQALVLQGKL